jgi:hypothetical protein
MTYLKYLVHAIKKHDDGELWHQVEEKIESVSEKTKSDTLARLTRDVIEMAIDATDEQTFLAMMHDRGCDCARNHGSEIENAKRQLRKSGSPDAYLEALVKPIKAGFAYHREADALYLVYKPRYRGVRCFCPLLRRLPDDILLSLAHCECSRSSVQYFWQQVLERTVAVEIVSSAVSGGTECRFRISI